MVIFCYVNVFWEGEKIALLFQWPCQYSTIKHFIMMTDNIFQLVGVHCIYGIYLRPYNLSVVNLQIISMFILPIMTTDCLAHQCVGVGIVCRRNLHISSVDHYWEYNVQK